MQLACGESARLRLWGTAEHVPGRVSGAHSLLPQRPVGSPPRAAHHSEAQPISDLTLSDGPFSGIPAALRATLTQKGYDALTPVQAAVIEPEARDRDLVVSARTGSGKTVAFGLAMGVELLKDDADLPRAGAPLALAIAPTRELALQVSRELEWLYAGTGARITTCVGGMDPSKERRTLYQGAHIIVGTPGRLRDHLERGAMDLSALRYVVLDEADEMLDMGFRDDLEEILDATPAGRRTLLFSATMPKPIVALAKRYQSDALRISTVEDGQGHGDISYQAVTVSPSDIENAVINLLRFHEAETAMLFCATRDNVRHLHATLVERGFAAVALSGEHSQNERNTALQALRDKRARVCVATDVAARGIDVASLSLVIHVELPRDAEALQHRSGRTGRAGKKGTAVLIVPFPRRRRVEMMLRDARIKAEWGEVPSAEAIRAQDHARLIETLMAPIEASEEELTLAARLLEAKSPEDLAVALVRAHASQMPSPEDLIDLSTRNNGRDPDGRERPQHHREGFDDTVWFRMDIGRGQRADPRWILPLLCRRGHITRDEIGAIRIAANETFFQIPRNVEAKFRAALARTAVPGSEDESGIVIEPSDGTPRDSAKSNARGYERPTPKPHRGSTPRTDAPRDDRPRNDGPREHRPTEHRPTEHRPAEHRVADHRDGGGAGGAAAYSGQPPAYQAPAQSAQPYHPLANQQDPAPAHQPEAPRAEPRAHAEPAPDHSHPAQAHPAQAHPEQAHPEQAHPEQARRAYTAPEQPAPGQTAPERPAPERPAAEPAAYDHSPAPQAHSPAPEPHSPEPYSPQAHTPQPYSPLAQQSPTAGAAPVEARRATLAPRTDAPHQGNHPPRGKPAFRDGGAGKAPYKSGSYKDGGHRDSGHRDSGHRDSGHRDSGHRDSGNRDSGNRDAGKAPYKSGGPGGGAGGKAPYAGGAGGKAPYAGGAGGKAPYKGGPGKAYAAPSDRPRGDSPRSGGFKGKPGGNSGGRFKGKPPRGR